MFEAKDRVGDGADTAAGVLEIEAGGKGLLRGYIAKMTGLSRAQATRLMARYRPDPQGRPGYLRVDTVHDLEGIKGVYPINAVDKVTQWQVVATAASSSITP